MLRLVSSDHPNGKSKFTVWKESGDLNVFATAFLVDHSQDPLNTSRADFEAIKRLHIIAELFDITDFEHRISYAAGLSKVELKSINDAFQFKTEDLSALLEQKRQGIISLDLFRQLDHLVKTSKSTQLVRKSSLRKYFRWLMKHGNAVLDRYVTSKTELSTRQLLPDLVSEQIKLPKRTTYNQRSKYNPVDLSQLEEFVESYDPYQVWSDPVVALRNSVMFDLQYFGTLRQSEVLLLKFQDIHHSRGNHPNQITIEDRREDPEDPRKIKPAAKTGRGHITIPEESFQRLEQWKDSYNDIFDDALDLGLDENVAHNFLFIGTYRRKRKFYGRPLSIPGYVSAFSDLSKAAGLLKPGGSHALRHLCAMRYVRRRRLRGDDIEVIRRDMRQFFRWSQNSQMPDYYTSHENHGALYDDLSAELAKDN